MHVLALQVSVGRLITLAAGAIATFSGENFVGRAHSVVVANAILAAASALRPGDVMLIEQHVPGPATGRSCPCNCGQWEYVPMEFYQESFDAIRRATAANIIVIEAAANGGQDLDQPVYSRRFDRAVERLGCNFGGRQRCRGWTDSVFLVQFSTD